MSIDVLLDPTTHDLRPFNILVDDADEDRGDEVTAQRIRRRVLTFLGEWILDQTVGVPYAAWGQQSPPPETVIADLIRATILEVPRVARVERVEVSFSAATQRITLSARAVLVSGGTVFVKVLPFGALGNPAPALEAST